MSTIKTYVQKLASLLRIHKRVDGLEVSDQVLRIIYFERNAWHAEAVRLAPGVMAQGKINDAGAFAAALAELKSKIPSAKGKDAKLNVFVALSSVNMYSQVFTLPFMGGEDLEKAISLNVQMASPVDIKHAYFDWQLLGRDEKNLRSEIAAAFVDRTIVDEMTKALYAAGFIAVGVESRALALARALREKGAGVDKDGSYLLIDVDNSGIDFLILRKGKLYFEYANSWTDIADEKGQISVEKFQELLAANVRQVLNFYSQHWPEPLMGIVLSAGAFKDQATQGIQGYTTLPILPFVLDDDQIPEEWFVALGCGLRGSQADQKIKEINLSGSTTMDVFYEERMVSFLVLWRVLVPVVLGGLIVMLVLADNFLAMTKADIESSAAFIRQPGQSADVSALEASSTAFNNSVALVADAEQQISHSYRAIADIDAMASANGVTIGSISFQAPNAPILIAGSAPAETQIAAFRNAVQADPHFGTINLSALNVQTGGTGGYTFSMSFSLAEAF